MEKTKRTALSAEDFPADCPARAALKDIEAVINAPTGSSHYIYRRTNRAIRQGYMGSRQTETGELEILLYSLPRASLPPCLTHDSDESSIKINPARPLYLKTPGADIVGAQDRKYSHIIDSDILTEEGQVYLDPEGTGQEYGYTVMALGPNIQKSIKRVQPAIKPPKDLEIPKLISPSIAWFMD